MISADEPRGPTPPSRSRFLARLLRPHAPAMALGVAAMLLSAALATSGPLLVRRAIDRDIAGKDLDGLRATVLLYAAVQLGHLLLAYGLRVGVEGIGQSILATLRRRLVDHLLALPMAFHDRHPAGKLLSRVGNDVQALRALFSSASVTLISDGLLLIAMLGVMAATSLRLTLVLVAVIPAVLLWSRSFHRRTHPQFLESRKLMAEVCARVAEMVATLPMLRAYERRAWALQGFAEVNGRRFGRQLAGERLFIYWFHGLTFLQVVAHALVLLAGGHWALQGSLTLGTLVMFLGYVRRFFAPLMGLSEQVGEIQRALSAAERVEELLAEPVTVPVPVSPRPWPSADAALHVDDVWFRYGDGEPWALSGVSFTIPPGEQWAVVGATGSGKSTLVSLLLRFHDPVRGAIRVGDVDLRDLSPEELRRRTGLVLQDVDLFPADVRANVTMGRPLPEAAIDAALGRVAATDLVARLPRGLSTDLAEHGANLSLGERQLLSFARAVVHEPAVLVLDEATSALDPATEQRLAEGLSGMLQGRTALVIAHRLSTIRACHRILVLHQGRIVEEGAHGELIELRGRYEALHRLQQEEGCHVAA